MVKLGFSLSKLKKQPFFANNFKIQGWAKPPFPTPMVLYITGPCSKCRTLSQGNLESSVCYVQKYTATLTSASTCQLRDFSLREQITLQTCVETKLLNSCSRSLLVGKWKVSFNSLTDTNEKEKLAWPLCKWRVHFGDNGFVMKITWVHGANKRCCQTLIHQQLKPTLGKRLANTATVLRKLFVKLKNPNMDS